MSAQFLALNMEEGEWANCLLCGIDVFRTANPPITFGSCPTHGNNYFQCRAMVLAEANRLEAQYVAHQAAPPIAQGAQVVIGQQEASSFNRDDMPVSHRRKISIMAYMEMLAVYIDEDTDARWDADLFGDEWIDLSTKLHDIYIGVPQNQRTALLNRIRGDANNTIITDALYDELLTLLTENAQ